MSLKNLFLKKLEYVFFLNVVSDGAFYHWFIINLDGTFYPHFIIHFIIYFFKSNFLNNHDLLTLNSNAN